MLVEIVIKSPRWESVYESRFVYILYMPTNWIDFKIDLHSESKTVSNVQIKHPALLKVKNVVCVLGGGGVKIKIVRPKQREVKTLMKEALGCDVT